VSAVSFAANFDICFLAEELNRAFTKKRVIIDE